MDALLWRVENSVPEPGDLKAVVAELRELQESNEQLREKFREAWKLVEKLTRVLAG